jgi:hypothetical protein
MRILIPALLFAFQIGAIAYARFVPTRYFCWAPFDIQTDYEAKSVVNGHQLSATEFRERYRRPMHGFDNRSPQHVIDMLQQVEEKRLSRGESAVITMTYRVNGKAPLQWHWPPDASRQP